MDDSQDDVRCPPNHPYPSIRRRPFSSSSSSSHRPKISAARNSSFPPPIGHGYAEEDDEDELNDPDEPVDEDGDEEEDEEGGGGYRQIRDDDDDEDDDDDDDDEDSSEGRGKRRKLDKFALGFELAPRLPRPAAPQPACKITATSSPADWSEDSTVVLLDAWGDRYVQNGRKSLRSDEWSEVAKKVSQSSRTTRSDAQCRNRLDTLKKKYKIEKSKIVSGAAATSSWPFFSRLDDLLGPNHKPTPALPAPANPTHPSKIPAGVPIQAQFPQRQRTPHHSSNQSNKRARSPPSVSSRSAGMSADSSDGFPPEPAVNGKRGKGEGEEVGLRELTQAILTFGKLYERVENSKLQQAMEMEKQRMAFARELELQRVQFFMKTQMELTQLKSRHLGGRSRRRDEAGASGNHHQNDNSSNSNNGHNSG